jgi:hypothetical protein
MDIANENEMAAWVDERLRALGAPHTWQPDATAARERVDARFHSRPVLSTARVTWVAVGSLACLLFSVSPGTRTAAAQLWQWLTISRVDVARVNFDDLPDEAASLRLQTFVKPEPPAMVRDVAEAQARAGFIPRLPRGILAQPHRLSTMGQLSIGTVLRASDVELALRHAAVEDQAVPKEWDDVHIALNIGPTIIAEWPDISLMQGLPPTLTMPPDFDFGAFSTAMLRAAGMGREPAQQFGRRMAATPALLFGISLVDDVAIREVRLNGGPATVIEDFDDNGSSQRVAVIWSVVDRIYLLSGKVGQDQAVAIAKVVQ